MAASPAHAGVITLALRTKVEIYEAWMPFIRGGGLFVPSQRTPELGDQVYMLLSLANDPEKIPVSGKVAWLNPPHAAGGRPQGFGVSLEGDPAADDLRKLIEGILAGALGSARPTHTI